MLLCLVPRALMGSKTAAICPDGALYIQLARALDQGDLQGGLAGMHLNTYPVVLVLMHRLGLDWELAGKLWGVVISSLVVLPLFGWVRRQFDDRVATAACILYAVHANLIEWSPEMIRGPTFWLLFVLSLYLLWRAVTEVRWVYFAAAGTAITLAALTRIEGLLLLIPLACWSITRWRALREARGRLAWGAVSCAAVGPLLLVAANLTWLRNHPHWEFSRLRPLTLVGRWFNSATAPASEAAEDFGDGHAETASAASSTPISPPRASLGAMSWTFIRTFTRGLTPVFALLMFAGVLKWWRVWARRDHQPLMGIAVAITAGIWVHLWSTGVSSYRYPLPIALMGCPFAALALLGLSARVGRLAARFQWPADWQRTAIELPLVLVAATGLIDSLSSDCEIQQGRLLLGRWIAAEYGPAPSLIGPAGLGTTAGYYAGGPYRTFGEEVGHEELMDLAGRFRPQVILLTPRQLEADRGGVLIDRMKGLGFELVDVGGVPRGREEVSVFAHRRAVLRAARRSPADSVHR